jgi:hypothetical protein
MKRALLFLTLIILIPLLNSNKVPGNGDKPYAEGNEFFVEGFKLCKYEYVATVMNSIKVEPDWETVALQLMEVNEEDSVTQSPE